MIDGGINGWLDGGIGGVVDALLGKEAALVEDVEQHESGEHDEGSQNHRHEYRGQCAGRGRGGGERQALRQDVGPLRHTPGK